MKRMLALLLLALCASLASAGTDTITHEAMFLMKRVGTPALSPDGTQVAVSVTEPSYDSEKQTSDIWLVPADGSAEPRQLTFSKASEGDLAWSPDGRRLAFTAKREGDEQNQVYVLDLRGGEAMRITTLPLAARAPQWSPDGTRLLVLSGSWPEATDPETNEKAAKERKDRKSKVRIYEGFPIRNFDRWLDETQTRLYVVPVERDAKAKDLLSGSKLLGVAGVSGAAAPAWTPDGRAIVFAASTNRDVSAWDAPNTHLFEIGADGGEPRQLTSGTADYGSPKFRSGAAEICYSYSEEYRKIYALGRVA
ncbi:MAG TPA: S9 family peptidase, partial [Thermoanaerobaculia bacterium]